VAVQVRDAAKGDEDFILALNAAGEPAVSEMSAEDLAEIAGWAHPVLVAEEDGEKLGFIILVRPGSLYPCDNYAWFEGRFPHHLYVDRIAVSAAARGKGVGRALYDETIRIALANGDERVTCEVNEQP